MITFVLLSLLQFAPALASCPAPQFAPQSTFAAGIGLRSVAVGDFNLFPGDQEEAQIAVTVIVRGRTEITNTATVSSDSFDLNLANNTASITATVSPGKGGKK
jgi:hypothetical protein